MCYFQQSNCSQKGYLGFVRGDGWRGFEGFSFSWLNADWIIHGHPTGSWAAVKPISHVCVALQLRCPLFFLNKTGAGGCCLFKTGAWFGGGNFTGIVLIRMNRKAQSQTLECISLVSGRWREGTKPSSKCSLKSFFWANSSVHKDSRSRRSKTHKEKHTCFWKAIWKMKIEKQSKQQNQSAANLLVPDYCTSSKISPCVNENFKIKTSGEYLKIW